MIKYRDNTQGVKYGSDHTLTNNWNPNHDYGNEYVRVYFRIDTPSYRHNHYFFGFATTEDGNAWHTEASNLIKSFGILEDCGFKVEHSNDKQAYLYAHPDMISGVVRKNDVRKIAEAINQMNLSSIRWVDLYETVYDISDDEYEAYLDGKQEKIRKALFEESHTARTTKYYDAFDVARHIAKSVRLHRLGLNDGENYSGGQTIDYILRVADKMIEDGYLKCIIQNECKYIRSLNKTEQKKMKLFL